MQMVSFYRSVLRDREGLGAGSVSVDMTRLTAPIDR